MKRQKISQNSTKLKQNRQNHRGTCNKVAIIGHLNTEPYIAHETKMDQSDQSFRCGDNCLTCNCITDRRTSYTFHSTSETRHITYHIDCNSFYMVHCNRCHKKYVGKTKLRLKDPFNEHRRPVDKQTNSSKPQHTLRTFSF